MMSKEHNNDRFEQDSQLIQEEFNERQENSDRLDSRFVKTLATKIGDIKVSEERENLPTYAIPTFDIQQFLFGDSEELTATKINNQKTVDQYLSEKGLPSTTKMSLSNIPTGWVLNLGKDENKDQDDDSSHPCSSDFSTAHQLSPLFNEMPHKNSPGKTGSTKKNARNHPYTKRSSEKKQERKERMRHAEHLQSEANSSSTNGLDAEDGCFGEQFTDQ